MQFGNLNGLVNGTESVVFDYEVTGSAVASISTGSILNGDDDVTYTIIVRSVDTASNAGVYARLNNDSSAIYGTRTINGNNATVTDRAYTSDTRMLFNDATLASNVDFGFMRIHAKTGAVRLANGVWASRISGTTVTFVDSASSVYNETSTNITSITFLPVTGQINIGTRIIILKTNNFTNGTPTGIITTPYIQGSWYRVQSTTHGSDVANFTWSSLDGDRDVLYLLTFLYKGGGASGSANITINGDTGANYGEQNLYANLTTASASRNTAQSRWRTSISAGANRYYTGYFLIFAKTGQVRTAVGQTLDNALTTTPSYNNAFGCVWNNTANNITSITFTDPNAGSQILTGSQFNLYALRPNG